MYGKIFDSMYEGTLYGHWQAIVTLQQMIVLCDSCGVLDMTPLAISARTSIPLDIIEKGIEVLSAPDPHSRTPGEDGRRISLLDDHRPWGWKLVNHAKYQKLKSMEEKREADRKRISERRNSNKNSDVAACRGMSPGVANVADVAHADADTDVDQTLSPADAGEVTGGTGHAANPGLQLQIVGGVAPVVPDCPHQRIVDLYHEVLPTCPKVREWNAERQGYLRARWREKSKAGGSRKGYTTTDAGIAFWRRFFDYVKQSRFLMGQAQGREGQPPFVADLEWLLRPRNFARVIEGRYHRDEAA